MMLPPDLAADWEGKTREDQEAERRQLLLYTATVVDPKKQGSKHQLLSAVSTWEKLQDAILDLGDGLTP